VWDGVLLIWLAVCDTSILVSHTDPQNGARSRFYHSSQLDKRFEVAAALSGQVAATSNRLCSRLLG
jgi:hypothetical protein